MKVKTITLHEVEVRFSIEERELDSALDNGLHPQKEALLREGTWTKLVALADLIQDALESDEMGCPRVEDVEIAIDGVTIDLEEGVELRSEADSL